MYDEIDFQENPYQNWKKRDEIIKYTTVGTMMNTNSRRI